MCGTLRAEGDAREALGRDRLLLDVDRLAVGVVRPDVDGARRPRRADPVAGHVAVAGQHEDVVAQGLEVVRDVVARDVALVVELGHLLVGLLRQVAAEAARVPGRVAGDAAHVVVGVGAGVFAGRRAGRPRRSVRSRTGPSWPGAPSRCSALAGIDRVGDLDDLPGQVGLDHRVLDDLVAPALEPALLEGRAQGRQVPARPCPTRPRRCPTPGRSSSGASPACRRCRGSRCTGSRWPRGPRRRAGVAVHVLDEVAIDAVHPLLEVDVELVDGQPVALRLRPVECGLLRGRGILRCDTAPSARLACATAAIRAARRIVVRPALLVVEQVAVPVLLEDRAEDPAVAVEVGELGVPSPAGSGRRPARGTPGRTSYPARRSRRGWTSSTG